MALTLRDALELIVQEQWAAGQDQFVDQLLTFIELSEVQRLNVIKNRLQNRIDDLVVTRDAILPNAQAAVDTIQAEIDELQEFIDNN